MKYADIIQKTDKELTALLAEQRKQLGQARIDMRTKQVANVKQIAVHKTAIAQMLTAQRQRQLQANQATPITKTEKEEANNG
jgi:ribosomal protein L29